MVLPISSPGTVSFNARRGTTFFWIHPMAPLVIPQDWLASAIFRAVTGGRWNTKHDDRNENNATTHGRDVAQNGPAKSDGDEDPVLLEQGDRIMGQDCNSQPARRTQTPPARETNIGNDVRRPRSGGFPPAIALGIVPRQWFP